MKTFLKVLLIVVCILVVGGGIYTWRQFTDKHPGYALDLQITSDTPGELKIGFGKTDITPVGFDTWTDKDGDARYTPNEGDSYQDLNNNGKFDAVWLAGFQQNRPATGVNDPLWARSMVIDDGATRLGICVIDMIGFGHDDVVTVRKRFQEPLELDYLIVASTHVHSSPDLMGLWGPNPYTSGIDKAYKEQVMQGIFRSLEEASLAVEPAYLKLAINESESLTLVGDSREPFVYDEGIRIMQVLSKQDDRTLGILLNWGNHPETFWSGNTEISSDFPHYWREYMENGIYLQDSLLHEGLGGIALFMNGALGGLMTTRPNHPIIHPYSGALIMEESAEKVDAQGLALAKITFKTMNEGMLEIRQGGIDLRAKTLELAMDNNLFRLAAWLGIFDRGFTRWGHIRSEVAAWTLGSASFVHVPGELYPEILNGGVESPTGADFGIEPVEVPSIRSQMPGRIRFFSGMANDMIGYIVPKSQWDEKPPFTYGRDRAPYGEVNSLGPNTAPTIHTAVLELLNELSEMKKP
ncbi:hypothetical protein [Lunatimonas salinarum]|uniref:hypothetical protein n=1 Tax=Lunatimonas salinarum TaxID=1774590 RepID=UPI001AE0D0B1|nr:hypothetical protein [Lunatimonas salinarum]